MTETKTETLESVTSELSRLAPMRFGLGSRYPVAFFGYDCWDIKDFDGAMERVAIEAACREECEERDMGWKIATTVRKTGVTEYIGTLVGRSNGVGPCRIWDSPVVDSPALAIATALRDALKAEAA